MSKDYTLTISIPVDTKRHAEVLLQSLSPDPELKPELISKEFSVEDGEKPALKVTFIAQNNKILRVAVNSLLDSVIELLECIEELEHI
ncbi:similar to Saccharomyces cerevisiae YKR095W-A PCC1 Component of the EKC/KEOPS protein complex [Geotrichum candidum]|uniref:Similar to Saccharomyces cerevisiae YKR095W-A PCC1 Component of the EKC/KEOPS protein complex n=1 Tax=Geotrichum candidum TaxID=1173061 RepID=A0A0J9X350_GEOCN|nr:similar to Saccharomyces cerevisiae YKR095W-A PCC1 Component of the EKC/KEOPS protein complex [Geotrichum candidum]